MHVLDNVRRIALFCVWKIWLNNILRKQEIILCSILLLVMLLATSTNAKPIITNDNFWFMILGEDERKRKMTIQKPMTDFRLEIRYSK